RSLLRFFQARYVAVEAAQRRPYFLETLKCHAVLTLPLMGDLFRFAALLQRHDQTGDDYIRDGQRQEKLPAEGHELVIAETRQRAADPDVNKDENENPQRNPQDWQKRLQNRRAENRPR